MLNVYNTNIEKWTYEELDDINNYKIILIYNEYIRY